MSTIVKASLKNIRSSCYKVSIVANLIKFLSAADAMEQLFFCKKQKIARLISSCLKSAIANAENNHGLMVDRLKIHSIVLGRGKYMKRMRPCAKGKGVRIKKPLTNLYLSLVEYDKEVS